MKTLFISNDPKIFNPGSAVRARLAAYAALMGELHVVSAANADAKEEHEGNLFLYPVRGSKLFRLPRMERIARAVIRAQGIEIVSAQDPFEYGRVALRAIRGTPLKLHLQVHTDFLSPYFARESWKNRLRVRVADRVLPRASHVRAVSERVKQSLVARYGDRIPVPSVIPIAVPAFSGTAVALPPHTFSFTLIAVSRLEKEKRLEDLLQALALVRVHYQNTGLFIAGDGRERALLEKRAQALGLGRNVVFLGWRDDYQGLMKSANAFVQASAYEGYGSTLIEAACVGTPIITTDVGIVGEVLTPGQDALVSPPLAPPAFAANIGRLIEDNQLRRLLSDHARAKAEAHLRPPAEIASQVASDIVSAYG